MHSRIHAAASATVSTLLTSWVPPAFLVFSISPGRPSILDVLCAHDAVYPGGNDRSDVKLFPFLSYALDFMALALLTVLFNHGSTVLYF